MTKRIGVLGGSFNPIHLGHMHIAGTIQTLFSLSEVHFVVAAEPPHKVPEDLILFSHRYAMVSLATAETASFLPSLAELEPKASPFSVDTMEKLSHYARREKGVLYFIAGGDSLAEVKTWRESEKLLSTYNFVFAVRPGAGPANPRDVLPEKTVRRVRDLTKVPRIAARRIINEPGRSARIYIVDVNAPDISATQIRRLASSGKSILRMVPRPVSDYIRKLRLYGE
jgi:nicotinate-nucleotide adenylyltransferase